MSKRLAAKTGEYQDKQSGETKGDYVQIGVILNNNNGDDFLLLDPTVSLAGVLAKQNALEFKKGGTMRDNVMCGIYEEQPKQNNSNQGGFNNQNQNHNKGGFNNQSGNRN